MSSKPGTLRHVQYLVEYALVRGLSGIVGLLPERLAVAAGKTLGLLYWSVAFFRRRVARQNIEKAMPGEMTPGEVRRLVKRVFIHLGLTAIEALWIRNRINKENIKERFPVEGAEAVGREHAAGHGTIGFTPHLGNWELFGGAMAVRLGRLTALARPTNNPFVERYTTRLREQMGINVLSTRAGVRPMIAALRNGDPLAILIDQHVNRAFVPVKFFGRHAATTAVVASLALRLNLPVFAAYSLRDGYTFRHHGYVEGPLNLIRTSDNQADVRTNTQLFNDKLEEIIRRHPEQWLWTHRRWKLADRLARSPQKESRPDV